MLQSIERSMRTGKELILATKPYAVDSSARSWWHILSTALLLALALAGTLWNFHFAGKLMCSMLAGLLYLRFFVIYHDQQHEAILPRSRLAEGLMRAFGILILSPSSVWRSSHNHHHNHNSKLRGSHIGSYPIMSKAQYLKAPKALRFKYLFMRHPLTILFGYVFVFLYGMCLYPCVTKLRENYDGLIAFLVHISLAVAITWCFGWTALLLTLVIPHFIASAIGSYLFYAQHNFPSVTFSVRCLVPRMIFSEIWSPGRNAETMLETSWALFTAVLLMPTMMSPCLTPAFAAPVPDMTLMTTAP